MTLEGNADENRSREGVTASDAGRIVLAPRAPGRSRPSRRLHAVSLLVYRFTLTPHITGVLDRQTGQVNPTPFREALSADGRVAGGRLSAVRWKPSWFRISRRAPSMRWRTARWGTIW